MRFRHPCALAPGRDVWDHIQPEHSGDFGGRRREVEAAAHASIIGATGDPPQAGLFARAEAIADTPGANDAKADHLVRLFAYLLVIELDGWEQLAREHGLEPCALRQGLPASDRLQETEAAARRQAYTVEEMARHLSDYGPGAVPRTAESVGRELRELFNGLLNGFELPPE